MNQLENLRKFAATHRISELIWSIYERTSLLEIMTSLPNGKQRRVNLEALYERAASYESAGFRDYTNSLISSKECGVARKTWLNHF
ncbi:hypothetical protein SDC49_15680 [Lactobacillus sp. R2/2]|nr:hypothetical protein [Lactobacillus sp. R2/2]